MYFLFTRDHLGSLCGFTMAGDISLREGRNVTWSIFYNKVLIVGIIKFPRRRKCIGLGI